MSASDELLQSPLLGRYGWVWHAFTTRRLGRESEFNLGYATADDAEAVTRNRRRLLRRLGALGVQLVTLRQRHTDIIRVVERARSTGGREPDGAQRFAGDAAITAEPELLVAVQVADCVPLLLVEPRKKVVAAVHAGWRGTVKRIAEKTVGRMRQEFGCDPARIRAAMGPSIRRCCYEVGREVVEQFEAKFAYAGEVVTVTKPSPHEVHWQQSVHALLDDRQRGRPRPAVTAPDATRYYVDLVAANRLQLEAAGVPAMNLWVSPLCTACYTDCLFSHRAERGNTGRMMGLVGIRKRTRGGG